MTTVTTPQGKNPRDIRLDVFRGLCLVIIFIAHVWDNAWAAFIPARFGFSDATEIFVFCSGMASAIAFGGTYRTHGFLVGSARVAFRCWQVFWSHIGVLLVAAGSMILVDAALGTGSSYFDGVGLGPLLGPAAAQGIAGMLTLGWVPHYFDILPMYLVILVMIPVVMALSHLGKGYVAAFVVLTWAVASTGRLNLPAEPWSDREWFFNPFAWQLVFFTGFAFMSGWLPAPRVERRLVQAAATVVVLTIPLAWAPLTDSFPGLQDMRTALAPLTDKTKFGALRYLHFISLAYLAFVAAGERGRNLTGPVAELLRQLGQQSLAIFMSGLLLSFMASTALNLIGRGVTSVAIVNLVGIAVLIGIARMTAYFKSAPWSRPARPAYAATGEADGNSMPLRLEAARRE
jgi:hypothetical protein